MAISLKASKTGLILIDRARRTRGWFKSQEEWQTAADASPATLRRFWAGQPIMREKFTAICGAVGVDWEEIADIETTPDLPGTVQKMKRLYTRAAELDLSRMQQDAGLDEETIRGLCHGWLFELFALMVKATETANPDKTFLQLTLSLIHKVGTLFESLHEEEKPGCFVEVRVQDEPGALHEVTGVFAEQAINIQQIHIVPDGPGMAMLKIYCEKICDRKAAEFEQSLERLPRAIRAEISSLCGHSR